jgi:hypothetical protein
LKIDVSKAEKVCRFFLLFRFGCRLLKVKAEEVGGLLLLSRLLLLKTTEVELLRCLLLLDLRWYLFLLGHGLHLIETLDVLFGFLLLLGLESHLFLGFEELGHVYLTCALDLHLFGLVFLSLFYDLGAWG